MNTKHIKMLMAGLLVALSHQAQAANYSVGSTGQDFATIQEAINFAAEGDVIQLKNAFHIESNIVIEKSLTLEGESMRGTVLVGAATRGEAKSGLISIKNAELVTIRKMTLQNGFSTKCGAAVNSMNSNIMLEECRFSKNVIEQSNKYTGGAAIHLVGLQGQEKNATLINCQFDENSSSAGGGAANISHLKLYMQGCTFANNSAQFIGGAIMVNDVLTGKIENCTFYRNKALVSSGAMNIWSRATTKGDVFISNCTFVENDGGASSGGINSSSMNAVVIDSSLFVKNVAKQQPAFRMQSTELTVKNSLWEEGASYYPGRGELFKDENNNRVVNSLDVGDYGDHGGLTFSYAPPAGGPGANTGAIPTKGVAGQRRKASQYLAGSRLNHRAF